jgi:hypothetical protein
MGAIMNETKAWRCFHCGEIFVDEFEAKIHFGISEYSIPGCILQVAAKDRNLLYAMREMEAERARYCSEDTDLHRNIYELLSRLHTEVRRAEEEGFARGIEAMARIAQE